MTNERFIGIIPVGEIDGHFGALPYVNLIVTDKRIIFLDPASQGETTKEFAMETA
jgi:hypothetical protein